MILCLIDAPCAPAQAYNPEWEPYYAAGGCVASATRESRWQYAYAYLRDRRGVCVRVRACVCVCVGGGGRYWDENSQWVPLVRPGTLAAPAPAGEWTGAAARSGW